MKVRYTKGEEKGREAYLGFQEAQAAIQAGAAVEVKEDGPAEDTPDPEAKQTAEQPGSGDEPKKR